MTGRLKIYDGSNWVYADSPDATTVTTAGAQTLTNKTISAANNTISNIANANLSTTAGEPGGAWKTWTPTFTNFTKGNATISAYYTQIGKTIIFRLSVILGTTSSMGTGPLFSLPVTSISYPGTATLQTIGKSTMLNPGVAQWRGEVMWNSTTTALIQMLGAGSTYLNPVAVTATVPFTWASTFEFYCEGMYEAA